MTLLLLKYKLFKRKLFKKPIYSCSFWYDCSYLAGLCYEKLQFCRTFLPFPGWWPAFLTLSGNAFRMYTLGSYTNSCLLLDLFMSKNILEMGKGISENHCTYGHADASHRHVSQILTFKAWGMGMDHGRETHWEEKILFLPPQWIRIFSHLQVAMKGISFM